ncbi:acetyl-CoA carboxylase carboxyltransferase subunit alpha [Staphylococcus epidermidis]|jgi:acetyl-CoA carboxylase carboxyl transferase subunit alpha|uniref:Acetyl-coenzyme A carboxylase carboxyl transferase subunit alpha n=4 Tax=Staphylococcus epidermidis TaxID=1282 RepID=ACCA_STAES|nr:MULTISPECIES: acetyl-CoA carboxylase carboxyltransferase subunit alpha [Staphylococcus]Q8CS67.1 RecName: Full=Acetyl-coenzyme A carboxylase carboxyl transferase subunit alpha; Short=ACCase subunit alpha; Short=Acetyl-CoA carboxylase carboxyltransferase subunit alpha [Staphylococcus epidermidis ATCC 12228]EHQ75933.1 acetyl-CoA carboxylase, carboxyl transferase, alpha subunit [Staphylococcus epidermidis VCU057]MDU7686382.1 acetyl-CoA carboxylase carboxyltransferase subunit alpha [Bacillota bact
MLDFEKPLFEIRNKIDSLKESQEKNEVDLQDEIDMLEASLKRETTKVYTNLKPWDRVQIARLPERPTTLDYIPYIFDSFIELHGDRSFRDDPAMIGGIGYLDGKSVTVIGQQRGKDTKDNIYRNFGMAHPEGYRKALRLMKQAEKFNRPIFTFIDTKGAYPGKAAEERGQSESIAKNLMEMASLTVPVIAVVIGEGGSGGALGIGISNRVLMLENSTYSVISPEGAAALLWKDSNLAQIAAETMKITALDLLDLGIIDEVINEPLGGAQKDEEVQALSIKKMFLKHLNELKQLTPEELANDRFEKFRKIGSVVE